MGIVRAVFKTLVFLLLLVITIALFLPAETSITRTTVIQASPSQVFALVNGYQHFNRFSPWHNLDPQTHYIYSGPRSGVGARMQWRSEHPGVGRGSSQITVVEQNRRVGMLLDFESQGVAVAWFELHPIGLDTQVTWGLQADAGFDLLKRYFNLLLDYFVGRDYEQGLRQLKILAEASPLRDAETAQLQAGVQLVEIPAAVNLLITGGSDNTVDAISQAIARVYAQLQVASQAAGLQISGAPYIATQQLMDDRYEFTAGLPVTGDVVADLPSGVLLQTVPAAQLACSLDQNSGADKSAAYQQVAHWISDNGYLISGGSQEHQTLDATNIPSKAADLWICFPVVAAHVGGA